jgi:transaldolase
MANLLETLRQHTIVVADTGDFEAMQRFRPTDATTNPSLILKAVQQPAYKPMLAQCVAQHAKAPLELRTDHLLVAFGIQILNILPGRVSTEVDARLSFDTQATIERAKRLIALYESQNIGRDRVLIKIAATWEGIQAAQQLEAIGIHCNLTLLFSIEQAVACANAKVKLISPFVGRIYDWYKKTAGANWQEDAQSGAQDPGVMSVAHIYAYFKARGIGTEIMGASFRNIGQIVALSGCDLLTISPELMAELESKTDLVLPGLEYNEKARLDGNYAQQNIGADIDVSSEANFRFLLNQNAMASEKLSEGIRAFVADSIKLDRLLA